jgi:hypothetical protein
MIKRFVFGFLILITAGAFGQDLTATQTFPSTAAAGSSFTVEININRGSINGFMKFFQELPPGFTASEIDSKGGSFSFADNGAKVVWIAPPNEPAYTISYRVNVPADASGPKVLNAKFSYINNNERKIFEFEPKTITIGGSGASLTATSPAVKAAQIGASTPAKTANSAMEKTPPATTPADKTATAVVPSKPTPTTATSSAKETVAPSSTQRKETMEHAIKSSASIPTTGKTYRVQIGAFSSKPKLGGVQDITTVVLDNGITKYFSGNFSTLEEATKRKEEVAKKGFPGAFVVAFENGKIAK